MGYFRRRRRARVAAKPFPEAWDAILRKDFPLWCVLPEEDRRELRRHILIFLDEKSFEGCAGLAITDEMRVLIAAQACVLLLGSSDKASYYPTVSSILIYPHAYVASNTRTGPDGVVRQQGGVRLGEMAMGVTSRLSGGPVVLAWDHVRAGASDMHDARNVVFHEFAHALDAQSGSVNGAPPLPARAMYRPWARVLGRSYQQLIEDIEHHHRHLIDAYGASNPAEFFAVVTETFFERPVSLKAQFPELYALLSAYYRQDPARLFDASDRV